MRTDVCHHIRESPTSRFFLPWHVLPIQTSDLENNGEVHTIQLLNTIMMIIIISLLWCRPMCEYDTLRFYFLECGKTVSNILICNGNDAYSGLD